MNQSKARTQSERLELIHSLPQARIDSGPTWDNTLVDQGKRTIKGLTITLGAGRDDNGLYDLISLASDRKVTPGAGSGFGISELTIICDTLWILSPVRMPECNVTIFARRLNFASEGYLSTSPLEWDSPQAQNAIGGDPGKAGADGRHGGNLTVHVAEMNDEAEIRDRGGRHRPALCCSGGEGQKGGDGTDGEDGKDIQSSTLELNDQKVVFQFDAGPLGIWGSIVEQKGDSRTYSLIAPPMAGGQTDCTISISKKPVSGFGVVWQYGGYTSNRSWEGTDEKPTSGKDAVSPGKSGNGGNGGVLSSNLEAALINSQVYGGRGGPAPARRQGGRAGQPQLCYRYQCTFYTHGIRRDNSSSNEVQHEEISTHAGRSFDGEAGQHGNQTPPRLIGCANSWLHPELLVLLMAHIRSCFLSGKIAEAAKYLKVLTKNNALMGPMPLGEGVPWQPEMEPRWVAAGAEAITLCQRISGGLDFFGNPPGHMPLLSISGALRLYQMETDTALRMLLLSSWVRANTKNKAATDIACQEATIALLKESEEISRKIDTSQDLAKAVHDEQVVLEKELDDLCHELKRLEESLLIEAKNDEVKKAVCKTMVNMTAILLQVFPYGQPVLGGVAGVLSEAGTAGVDYMVDGDRGIEMDTGEAISRVKSSFGTAIEKFKAFQAESKSVVKEAKKNARQEAMEKGTKLTSEDYTELNKTKVSKLSAVGKNIGPAIRNVANIWNDWQMSEERIEARAVQLKAVNSGWKTLTEKIMVFQKKKAQLFAEIVQIGQAIGAAYVDLAIGAAHVQDLHLHRMSNAVNVDLKTAQTFQDMRERAITALLRATYDVVRAVEAGTLQRAEVDWFVVPLLDKIDNLITDGKIETITHINDQSKVLRTIFDQNLVKIRDQLMHGSALHTETKECDLTLEATNRHDALLLDSLNRGEDLTLDPLRQELIRQDLTCMRVASVSLESITFDPASKLPTKGDLEIALYIGKSGIMRAGTNLYRVRMDQPLNHMFTYHFKDQSISHAVHSDFAVDLLNFFLNDSRGDGVKGKLALPPAWSDMTLRISRPGLDETLIPKIIELTLRFKIDYLAAPKEQRVLDLRSNYPNSIIKCGAFPANDLLKGSHYLIFPSPIDSVDLCPLGTGDDWEFHHWKANNEEYHYANFSVGLAKHQIVEAIYKRTEK